MWTVEDSKFIYGVDQGDLYFLSINEQGEMVIEIEGTKMAMPDLIAKVSKLFPQRKIPPSFTLRVPQLINEQIDELIDTFDSYIGETGYTGKFKPLYPIKVNQHKREVTQVLKASPRYGLEAGTKSELFIILKVLRKQKDRIVMCNGVKDREYIQIVRNAIEDGYRVHISIESITEMKHVIQYLTPEQTVLYLRIKPYVSMHGYWGSSSGRNSKFGLNIDDLNTVIGMIKDAGLINSLVGIHAHPGSQVANTYELAQYFKFMVKTYRFLRKQGFNGLETINFGGGLPIDYDGRLPGNNLDLYSRTMVDAIMEGTKDIGGLHPNIMIEAGRAITAHSSMLIIQPLEFHGIFPKYRREELQELLNRFPELGLVNSIADILTVWERRNLIPDNLTLTELNTYEKDLGMIKYYLRKEFLSKLFTLDHLKLESVKNLITPDYFLLGNFSVFNGACDYVLIGQYFPILPMIDLHKQPETLIRLVDITCDSDGEISIYRTKVSDRDLFTEDGYPLSSKDPLEWKGFPVGDTKNLMQSYILVPLVGAYQDVIQFDHNLIGDLPDVECKIIDGEIDLQLVMQATNVQELLKEVGYVLENTDNPYISKEEEE